MKLQIYIEGVLIDLHDDESVVLNSSVQNVKDISKIFTDYSQVIVAPASKRNNQVFKHFHDSEITNGFDYRTRKDAFIEIDTLPFKIGKVQLEDVTVENNKPIDYKFRFFGSLVKLTDLFGDDELNDLNLVIHNHAFTSANVLLGFGSTLESGNIIYPLISSEENWLWDNNESNDIEYVDATTPSTTNGIWWNELKPAIKLQALIDAIETKYGITFTTDFFGTLDFGKLFMWASRDKGKMDAFGAPTLLTFDPTGTPISVFPLSVTASAGSDHDEITITVSPAVGFTTVDYTLIVKKEFSTGGTNSIEEYEMVGIGIHKVNLDYPPLAIVNVSFYIQSNENFTCTATNDIAAAGTGTVGVTGYVYMSDLVVDGILQKGQMPELKVEDFLTGLIKQNNLVIEATSTPNEFYINTLDAWYSEGNVYDITKYINRGKYPVSAPPVHNKLRFEYEEGETILNDRFRQTNRNINYGDLSEEFDNDGNEKKFELPFENVMLERLTSQLTGADSEVHIGKIIDVELEPVKIKPFIFYNRGVTTMAGNGIAFINDSGTRVEQLSYNNVGQENELEHSAITQTLHFGAEISTWTLQVNLNSLYANRYEDYITDLFSKQRRIFKFKAIFPDFLISKVRLNDKLIIDDRRYLINDMKTNLSTGEVDLELLNDIY